MARAGVWATDGGWTRATWTQSRNNSRSRAQALFLESDGTLLNDQKGITPGNRAAIEAALAAGHQVVITTGRPLVSAREQARRLGIPVENTVAAGDAANDLSTLRAAGIGVAMRNGPTQAHAAADAFTSPAHTPPGTTEHIAHTTAHPRNCG